MLAIGWWFAVLRLWQWTGFGFEIDPGWPALGCVAVPLLGVVAFGRAVLAARRREDETRRADRQWRLDHHVCLECGFDVRATPGQCPECGARQEKWWA